ncbi:hypothetical protein [Alteriqipengyuania lutimaris]|uniref:Uncharacterized protein n=1 Tax=Alteriqipengyuania lutimaris TaxID=1538146 RepID=A0A395LNA9_9SPHN|nr:hypothetical protein [Alteriqipengyuania lutimaris]MBB3034066.1 hypothetical protein [Alteriqipengyuania lutimaris]RDS76994.1 hypothetical protein DL238_04810 [Alteriqipengyuania lutimaris]
MTILAAIAVALRVALILLACAMLIAFRGELWSVIRRKPGWKRHLSTAIFTGLVIAGAIISSVNVFPDAGLPIARETRLAIVNLGLGMFLVATLTGFYRRALRCGPEKARAALLSGMALLLPGVGFVWLLTVAGANG